MPAARTPARGRTPSKGAAPRSASRTPASKRSSPAKKRSPGRPRAAAPNAKFPATVEKPKAARQKRAAKNPKTTHFEFSGPYLGPIGIILGLPVLVWLSAVYCGPKGWPAIPSSLPSWPDVAATFSWEALGVYAAWFTLQVVLHVVVPGRVVEGVQLRDGSRLPYKLNGWNCLLATHALLGYGHYAGLLDLTWVVDNYVQLTGAAILFSCGLSVYLYATSFSKRALLAEGGNSGIPVYDFFIGRELNPRVPLPGLPGGLDLKFFCELRPGLFLWHLINVACVLKQYRTTGAVSPALALVATLQALYVADSVYCEECILTTMDIIMDGFGFMLAFGDLAWVPAMYSLQGRFLTDVPQQLSPAYTALCAATALAGFYIFRSANAQKDAWKKDPSAPQFNGMPYVPTSSPSGTRLLAGGWWGISRHINYFGDWLLALGMCLPTGCPPYLVTYFYPAYFAVLLIHREMRDEHKCAAKYGAAWAEYKKRVPYRIVPFVY